MEARRSIDPAVRKALYAKAQKKILDEVYWMPFYVVHQIYGVKENLKLELGTDEVPRLQYAYWE
jgi:ABC-type transport system substrate-binding protein